MQWRWINITNVENFSAKKGIILFGSESNGIRKSLNKYIDDWISIDKLGNAESLNVSVSAGIIVNHLK